jgi:hypothetical protein
MTRNRKRERTGNRKKGFRGGTETESQRNRRTTVPVVVPVTLSLSRSLLLWAPPAVPQGLPRVRLGPKCAL